MTTLATIVLDIIIIAWPLHFIYCEYVASKEFKRRRVLKRFLHQVDHKLRWDRDIMSGKQLETANLLVDAGTALQESGEGGEDLETFLNEGIKQLDKMTPKSQWGLIKEFLEVMVVVAGVVMGIRGLLVQPFKIPTGSMRPTLYGINFDFIEKPEDAKPGKVKRFFDYCNKSRRYYNVTVKQDGYIEDPVTKRPMGFVNKFFFDYTEFTIAGVRYRLPGSTDNTIGRRQHDGYYSGYISQFRRKYYPKEDRFYYSEGDVLARGHVQLGDHLFVDRIRFHFFEPQRGDITVFVTDGIKYGGNPLRGRYYIKRLVGLPGDTLRIKDRRLYVKERDSNEFVLVDGKMHPAFDRIYSMKGGNRGYSNEWSSGARYLVDEHATFTLKDDQYFMLGDNSENSQDSRYWGVVPRRNIVGRASFVYWPILRRWGFPDKVPAEEFDSPPTTVFDQ
jgi:signal peptidase I